MNKLQKRFQAGQLTIGTFAQLASPIAIECMGRAGMDYVIIDSEHGEIGIRDVTAGITAADAAGCVPLVRINEMTRTGILHALDYGAQGLIVPGVQSAEEVQKLIQYAKFPPLGSRGYCPTRDGGWGMAEIYRQGTLAYFDQCNRETLLIPQCETAGCLEQIEEIAAMEGVDGIFVGPLDLSIALGCPMELDSQVMQAAIARVLAACQRNGKMAFIFSLDAQGARQRQAQGFDSVTIGADALLLTDAYHRLAESLHPQGKK